MAPGKRFPVFLGLPLFASCVWPTTAGLRTDAVLPAAGEVEAMVGGAVACSPAKMSENANTEDEVMVGSVALNPTDYWGFQGMVGLGKDLALSVGAASNDPSWIGVEIEARYRFVDGRARGWDVVALGGISPLLDLEGDSLLLGDLPGLQAGIVAGHPVGDVFRFYGGGRLNMVPLEWEAPFDTPYWFHPAMGLTARPELSDRLALVLGVETFGAFILYPVSDQMPSFGALFYAGLGPPAGFR